MRRRRRQQEDEFTRRDFMRAAACAAVGTTALVSTVWDLRMVNAAVAPLAGLAGTDYKALVCLFLYGGNDANNLIIPTNTDATDNNKYNQYNNNPRPPAPPKQGQARRRPPIKPPTADGVHTY